MEEIANTVANYGVTLIIVVIFLWDYIANKKEIKNTLDTMRETNTNIANCLEEMKDNNKNMEKSLELLQKSMDNTDKKIDKLLERK